MRGHARGVLRESHQVREQHGDELQAVRDLRVLRGRVARLQPVDDRSRQRVAQQFVGPPARAIQLPLTQEHQTLVPLQAVSRRHPDDGDRDEERVGEPELADRVVHDPVAHDVVVRDHQDAHDRRVRERQAAEDVAEHEDHHQAGVRPFGGCGGHEHPMRRPQSGVEQQDERHPLAPVRREPARVRDTEADHERRGPRCRTGSPDPLPDRRGSRCPPGRRTPPTARCPRTCASLRYGRLTVKYAVWKSLSSAGSMKRNETGRISTDCSRKRWSGRGTNHARGRSGRRRDGSIGAGIVYVVHRQVVRTYPDEIAHRPRRAGALRHPVRRDAAGARRGPRRRSPFPGSTCSPSKERAATPRR